MINVYVCIHLKTSLRILKLIIICSLIHMKQWWVPLDSQKKTALRIQDSCCPGLDEGDFFLQTSLPCESVSMIAVCQTWWYMSMIVYGKIVVYWNLNHLSGYHHFPKQPEMGGRAPLSAKVQCSVPFIACSRSIRWGHDILVRYSNF